MGMSRGMVINRAGLVKYSSGHLWMKRHRNMSGGLLEAREDSGSREWTTRVWGRTARGTG